MKGLSLLSARIRAAFPGIGQLAAARQLHAGVPQLNEPGNDLKEGMRQMKEGSKEAAAGGAAAANDTLGGLAEGVKSAAQWVADAAKSTVAYTMNNAGNVVENARDDIKKEVGARQGGGNAARADVHEAAVQAGLNPFTPESKGGEPIELERLRRNVESGHGPNTPEELAQAERNPELMRGDTIPHVSDGSKSPDSYVGGQPAGTVGKPPGGLEEQSAGPNVGKPPGGY